MAGSHWLVNEGTTLAFGGLLRLRRCVTLRRRGLAAGRASVVAVAVASGDAKIYLGMESRRKRCVYILIYSEVLPWRQHLPSSLSPHPFIPAESDVPSVRGARCRMAGDQLPAAVGGSKMTALLIPTYVACLLRRSLRVGR